MEHKGTVLLETERLILRRFTAADINQIFDNCWSEYEVWKWTNYKPMHRVKDVVNIAEMFTDKWLGAYDRPNRYSWAIQLKSTGEVIGRFFGMNPDDRVGQIELAYEIGQKWWNQGLITEAVKKVIEFFFCEVGLNRIYAYHASGNPASGRVMQKCGMVYEGTMRQACRCNNGLFDKVNYAILASDYFMKEIHMEKRTISLEYLQKYIKSKDYHPELTKEYFMKLTEEVGELSRAIRENMRPTSELQIKETIEEELWDVIYYVLAIANCYDIDLEKVIPLKENINNLKHNNGVKFDPASGIK